jgi:hypothetical protein
MSPADLTQSVAQHIFLDIVKNTITSQRASLFDQNTRLGAPTPGFLTVSV